MSGMMKQMNEMMQKMAGQMEERATHIDRGKLDQGTVKKIHEKMQSINKKLDALQKEDK
jgi:hypothetical protein